MKLLIAGIALFFIVETNAGSIKYPLEVAQGTYDMARAYIDMRKANTIGADKLFHARGNADAASRGEGGRKAAEVISNAREWVQERMGHGAEDSAADQRANEHGRNGGDPCVYWVTELEPKRLALKEVIDRHLDDYRTRMEPIVQEYAAKHSAEMESLRLRMEPIIADMQSKITSNIEETKTAMMPIVDAVRTKLSERLEELKGIAAPYVEEYKDQISQAYASSQSMDTQKLVELKTKVAPLIEEVKTNLQAIFETIVASYNKQ